MEDDRIEKRRKLLFGKSLLLMLSHLLKPLHTLLKPLTLQHHLMDLIHRHL